METECMCMCARAPVCQLKHVCEATDTVRILTEVWTLHGRGDARQTAQIRPLRVRRHRDRPCPFAMWQAGPAEALLMGTPTMWPTIAV